MAHRHTHKQHLRRVVLFRPNWASRHLYHSLLASFRADAPSTELRLSPCPYQTNPCPYQLRRHRLSKEFDPASHKHHVHCQRRCNHDVETQIDLTVVWCVVCVEAQAPQHLLVRECYPRVQRCAFLCHSGTKHRKGTSIDRLPGCECVGTRWSSVTQSLGPEIRMENRHLAALAGIV